jgi:hypothetical protein
MTPQFSQTDTSTLYDRDYLLWIETTVRQLREQDLEHLDWENLILELTRLLKIAQPLKIFRGSL